ncbi:ArsR/SmtB family transcription factor [Natronobacterium texcoconense]|uniref:Helix-turn-helix domain-containing protein n=1 Tax=Natronobacterium texcoconense TaxID=1095778 RepID=A0A1H1J1C8_NATTX|nr:helix-turn-helix domain-containing protein [Natronobacterium texcoconense]SDR43771.1 Helix-turn-helix domain-containing protein [Natronobacterium texcoconense]
MDLAGRLVQRLRDEPDDPTVVGLEGEDADQLFDALGSETSRAVLQACYEEGRTRSELAEELETSVQNVGYHVDKLESADLLEAVETRYGENGREVTVYEPSKRAVVVAAGEPGLVDRLAEAVDRLFAPIVLAGLFAMVVAVVDRGPERIGMLGDDAARTEVMAATSGTAAAVATFLVGVLVVLAADRVGVFDRLADDRRTGRVRLLLGRSSESTRRYAVSILVGGLVTFLALDLVAAGTGHRLSLAAWLLVQLVIPLGVVAAGVIAYANDGLAVSWAAASAPFVGIWGYLVAGEFTRGGIDPILFALGPVAVAIVAAPLGSIAYLVGRTVASWRGIGEPLSRRTIALLVAHPLFVVVIVAGWLRLVG